MPERRSLISDKNWKSFERRVAKAVGGRRQPVTGERAGADVESPRLVCQVKKGYSMPRYLRQWLDSMIGWRDENAKGKAAVLVWQAKGKKDKDSLVLLTLEDFQCLLTAPPEDDSSSETSSQTTK